VYILKITRFMLSFPGLFRGHKIYVVCTGTVHRLGDKGHNSEGKSDDAAVAV
jgi:hypothetical protein